uniref:Integrase catalytic domain-containing protein n=1 Tax=Aegilops tauschii subsp. strangulata TaxID=200361 RepID=A0A453KX44_AEGTS
GNLSKSSYSLKHVPSSILVDNGHHLPVTATGSVTLQPHDFCLTDVLVSPNVVTSLISVRRFTKDNSCSVEFYPCGFLVKDLRTRRVLMISVNNGDLYPFHGNTSTPPSAFTVSTSDLWHRRLGHPGAHSLSTLANDFLSSCNKSAHTPCNACQLGRQARLPFSSSFSKTFAPFDLIHCDLWTSPVVSFSGFQYYLVVLDDFTHYSWTFPLRNKSDTSSTLQRFFTFIHTQYNVIIKEMQCDNGGEFLNSSLRSFFSNNGIAYRFSCPHTSPQNGKAERLIRTTNGVVRSLLFQANLTPPPPFWVEALHTATYLLNRRPSRAINDHTPYYLLHGTHPTYDHLRVFGCLCFPNTSATMSHKLSPRSTRCIFLGYPLEHKGYRCYDLSTRRVIVSRHVVFDETSFPYEPATPPATQPLSAPDPLAAPQSPP